MTAKKKTGGASKTRGGASGEKKKGKGRPKITTDNFQDGWQEKMISLAKEGASDVELRAEVLDCICHETWSRLIDEDSDFSETVKRCKLLSVAWWEKSGRLGAVGVNKINPTVWIFNMKNRAGWADKQEIDQTISGGVIRTGEMPTIEDWAAIAAAQQKVAEKKAAEVLDD